MDHITGTAGTAALVFAGTDVDDLLVLTVLFLQARSRGRPRPWQIWVGQYLGIGALVAVSAAAALGLSLVPDRWVRLIGLLPLTIGLWGLFRAVRSRGTEEEPEPVATGVLSVAGITIANGADNISVYTPLFRTVGPSAMVLMIVVFAVLVALWCALARWLGSHNRIVAVVDRFGHWIVPLVFIALGMVIVLG